MIGWKLKLTRAGQRKARRRGAKFGRLTFEAQYVDDCCQLQFVFPVFCLLMLKKKHIVGDKEEGCFFRTCTRQILVTMIAPKQAI